MSRQFSNSLYSMVMNSDGNPYMEDNSLLLQNKIDGNFVSVPLTADLCEEFRIEVIPDPSPADLNDNLIEDTLLSNNDQFVWTEKSTLLLLEEYKKRKTQFRNPKLKKKTIWKEISLVMKEYGYTITEDILDKKFRNMKQRYVVIKDNNNKKTRTGTGRITWPYYNLMCEIFVEDKTVNPNKLISSTISCARKTSATNENPGCSKQTNEELNYDIYDTNVHINKEDVAQAEESEKDETSEKKGVKRKLTCNTRSVRKKSLDLYRKENLKMEAAKIEQMKVLNAAIQEYNNIQRQKLNVLKEMTSALTERLNST